MAKRWVENTGSTPKQIGGLWVLPGSGVFVDDPDPAVPVPSNAQAVAAPGGQRQIVIDGVPYGLIPASDAAAIQRYPWNVHPNLWHQSFAGLMSADDGYVPDLSGNGRDATRGANISIAQMNANAGYYTTLVAGSNGQDPGLHMPSINFDYDGGEILLGIILMKMAAPAADSFLLANATSSSANGFRFRARTTGYVDIGMYSSVGAVSSFSGNSNNVLLDGTLHQVGLMINGRTKTRSFWEDGALTRDSVGALASCDTRETSGLHIGTYTLTPTAIAHTGPAQIRAMAIMRWSATDPAPTSAAITALCARLRRNPGRPVAIGEI